MWTSLCSSIKIDISVTNGACQIHTKAMRISDNPKKILSLIFTDYDQPCQHIPYYYNTKILFIFIHSRLNLATFDSIPIRTSIIRLVFRSLSFDIDFKTQFCWYNGLETGHCPPSLRKFHACVFQPILDKRSKTLSGKM